MTSYTDWNCRLLNAAASYEETAAALLEMQKNFGISRFCLMSDVDLQRTSVAAQRIRAVQARESLTKLLPRTVKLKFASAVKLSPALAEETALEALTITTQRLLPLSLPLESYDSWIDTELNRLLYKRHVSLLFLSFELYPILYDSSVIERLMRIPNAAYQFNYKALADADTARIVSKLFQKGAQVLLGTSIPDASRLGFYEFDHYIKQAATHLGEANFERLGKADRALWK